MAQPIYPFAKTAGLRMERAEALIGEMSARYPDRATDDGETSVWGEAFNAAGVRVGQFTSRLWRVLDVKHVEWMFYEADLAKESIAHVVVNRVDSRKAAGSPKQTFRIEY